MLRGGDGQGARVIMERLAAIGQGEERVLLATGKYIGEGFDDARLDTLFLTMPVSWRGTIAQYAGRLHRLYDSKREVQNSRLRRPERAHAGADVRPPLPGL